MKIRKKIRKKTQLICIIIAMVISLNGNVVAVDTRSSTVINEVEPNNSYSTGTATVDCAQNYGALPNADDIDWWHVTFPKSGYANFWLNAPSGCNYYMRLYDGDVTLLEKGGTAGRQELIRFAVRAGETYRIRIATTSTHSNSTYTFITKWYASEKAYIFTYNYIEDGEERDNRLPTSIMNTIWNMGYVNPQYINNSAASVYESLSKANIFLFHNHGNAGNVTAYAASTGQHENIYAKNGPSRNINECPSLQKAKLVIWFACYTANTSPTYGNLVTETLNKGAASSIGWLDVNYSDDISNDWFKGFFSAAKEGEKLSKCLTTANAAIKEEYYDNMDDITMYTNTISWYTGNSNLNQVFG